MGTSLPIQKREIEQKAGKVSYCEPPWDLRHSISSKTGLTKWKTLAVRRKRTRLCALKPVLFLKK